MMIQNARIAVTQCVHLVVSYTLHSHIHSAQSFWVPQNNPFTTKPCADSDTFHTVWVTINSFTAKLCIDIVRSHFGCIHSFTPSLTLIHTQLFQAGVASVDLFTTKPCRM